MTTFFMLIAAASGQMVSAASLTPVAVPATEMPAAASAAVAIRTDNRRYCVKATPTGSRIARKECQTRAEWAHEGVDIDAK